MARVGLDDERLIVAVCPRLPTGKQAHPGLLLWAERLYREYAVRADLDTWALRFTAAPVQNWHYTPGFFAIGEGHERPGVARHHWWRFVERVILCGTLKCECP